MKGKVFPTDTSRGLKTTSLIMGHFQEFSDVNQKKIHISR